VSLKFNSDTFSVSYNLIPQDEVQLDKAGGVGAGTARYRNKIIEEKGRYPIKKRA